MPDHEPSPELCVAERGNEGVRVAPRYTQPIVSSRPARVAANHLDLSIVVPCFNSSGIVSQELPRLIEFLKSESWSYEVIAVDDGSIDGEVLRSICQSLQCRYLQQPKNLGKGAAVQRGMLSARGKYLIFMDADFPFELDALKKFYHYLDFKEFDMAVGDRTLDDSEYFDDISLFRKIASNAFTFLVGRFITTGMFDTQCGMKGFRKSVAQDLFSKQRLKGFAFDVEIIYIALKRNYDIKRIPVRLRANEPTSMNIFKQSIKMMTEVMSIKYHQQLRRYQK